MPARQKMTPVEVMIMFAILGILASITIPAMTQAQRRSQHAQRRPRGYVASPRAVAPDGQLNTIEVSKLSKSAGDSSPGQWIGALVRLAPIIFTVGVIVTMVRRIRQQMTRRRA